MKKNYKDLHIGLVGPLPPPAGGMATQLVQLKNLLEKEGAHVTVIQVNAPYQPQWAGKLPGIRAIFRLFPYLLNLWQNIKKVDCVHVLANSGWSWHLFAAPAVWIAHVRKRPVVINYRGGEAKAFFDRSFRWVAPTLKRASLITVPSGFLEHVFNEFGVKTTIVPNIINLKLFRAEDSQCKEIAKHAPTLVVTRNLEPIYDIGTAIEAFEQILPTLPEAKLVIAGSGPQRDELVKHVNARGLDDKVNFTGRLNREEIANLYQLADLVINPSLADNMPNSVLEALASKVPVVTTNVGGIPFLVNDEETALLVNPGDAKAMSQAILRVFEEPGLHDRLKENGHALVSQFVWDIIKETLLKTYNQALTKRT